MVTLGAVPFCQTNVPQTMYTIQTSNPIYGSTGNPYNKDRECGGSSGGEACLLGAGGSVLGIGNDTGGSVRNPAALCGVCSLKPTFGRHLSQIRVSFISSKAWIVTRTISWLLISISSLFFVQVRAPIDVDSVLPRVVGGFMASEVDGLLAAYRAYWAMDHKDSSIAPLPFNEDTFSSQK